MIKLHELNEATRCWLAALSEPEQAAVLDLATDMMLAMEERSLKGNRSRSGLGENGSVELVVKVILFFSERGTQA